MSALGGAYRALLTRLPPSAAWALWRAARALAAPRRRRLPPPPVAIATVAWGASEDELGALVARLVREAGGEPARLLVVTDCDAVHVSAAAGVRHEFVPPRTDWERYRGAESDYDAFVERRLRSILDGYRIAEVRAAGAPPDGVRRALDARLRI